MLALNENRTPSGDQFVFANDAMTENQPLPENDFQELRRQMVQYQIEMRGVLDVRVLQAMRDVPREEFVLEDYREDAYRDSPLPIGFGQTISQPYTVAFLVEALQLSGKEKVLEIGTGSGYQAAVLSLLAREVHSVERIPELGKWAEQRLHRLGYDNVHVHLSNGTLGWEEEAPYDAIVVTASSEELPSTYQEQLVEGGRIVIPLGPSSRAQRLFRFTLRQGRLCEEDLGGFSFVPLIGKHGWPE